VKLRFCGVRGSTPVAGPQYARVGGHTSCVAVSVGNELPLLVLDAGTGLQELVSLFGTEPFAGTILLTHLHWDHMQGLPFFPNADREDARVVVGHPAQGDPHAVMAGVMSPPYFPIGPTGLRGDWSHIGIEPGAQPHEGFTVLAHDVEHKGGRAMGYRVTRDGKSFAYVPDAIDDNDDAIVALAQDVDVLVRGAPFVTAEQARADLFGHGTVEHAVEIARHANVGRLVITHHNPYRTDEDIDKIAAEHNVVAATEGLTLDV
jgi:phosphoribosyl 1,2-cyclic phosphodiesterase